MFMTKYKASNLLVEYGILILNDKNIFIPKRIFNKTYFNYIYIIWPMKHENMRCIPAI